MGGLVPSTAWAYYGFPTLPLGQQLALGHLETYRAFPSLQAPASYNLDQVEEEIRKGQGSTDQPHAKSVMRGWALAWDQHRGGSNLKSCQLC
jgi:hypothetical protein